MTMNDTQSLNCHTRNLREASWLRHCQGAVSFCTGAGTAEMSRAVLESLINDSGLVDFHVEIPTCCMWEARPF